MTTVHDIRPTLNYNSQTNAYTTNLIYCTTTRSYTHSENVALSVPEILFNQAVETYQHVYNCIWSTAFEMASQVSSWGCTVSRLDASPIVFYRVVSPDTTNLYY